MNRILFEHGEIIDGAATIDDARADEPLGQPDVVHLRTGAGQGGQRLGLRDELSQLLESVQDVDQEAYTEESYAVFAQAVLNAEAVLNDENAGKQDLRAAVKAVQDAVSALEEPVVIPEEAEMSGTERLAAAMDEAEAEEAGAEEEDADTAAEAEETASEFIAEETVSETVVEEAVSETAAEEAEESVPEPAEEAAPAEKEAPQASAPAQNAAVPIRQWPEILQELFPKNRLVWTILNGTNAKQVGNTIVVYGTHPSIPDVLAVKVNADDVLEAANAVTLLEFTKVISQRDAEELLGESRSEAVEDPLQAFIDKAQQGGITIDYK